jgi:hypothetical protein
MKKLIFPLIVGLILSAWHISRVEEKKSHTPTTSTGSSYSSGYERKSYNTTPSSNHPLGWSEDQQDMANLFFSVAGALLNEGGESGSYSGSGSATDPTKLKKIRHCEELVQASYSCSTSHCFDPGTRNECMSDVAKSCASAKRECQWKWDRY